MASQTDFGAEEDKDTVEVPPISGDHEPVTQVTPESVQQSTGAPAPPMVSSSESAPSPSYNDRVFNVQSPTAGCPAIWSRLTAVSPAREVETIYQSTVPVPVLLALTSFLQPLAPRAGSWGKSGRTSREPGRCQPTRRRPSPLPTRSEIQSVQARTGSQASPTPSDSRPSTAPTPASDGALPPILKADAVAPRQDVATGPQDSAQSLNAPPTPKQSARSTFTNLRGRTLEGVGEPPMERTMSQFLGDTDSYISLDRVTLEPLTDEGPLPLKTPPLSGDNAAAPSASPFSNPSQQQAQSQGETQTISGAAQAPTQAEIQARLAAIEAAPSQAETQTLAGATQALAAAAKWRAEGGTPPAVIQNASFAAAATQVQHQAPAPPPEPTIGPGEARWRKDSDVATYDGLTAVGSEAPADVIDLDKLDIFEGLEDIDELSQIEVIQDVIIPGTTPIAEAPRKEGTIQEL